MSVIPCEQNAELREKIEAFAEVLKTQAHTLGAHGLDERDFYNSGLFRGAIERIRGQFSATLRPKREFVQHVLNHLEDRGHIASWDAKEAESRSDYLVKLNSGRSAVISLTGGMDGNNTGLFERPDGTDEFVIWSMMTNPGGDPRRNAWSGIHTRLSAEMLSRGQVVDGVIIWDMACGTSGRPCPKLLRDVGEQRLTDVGPFRVPPTCIYVFPPRLPTLDAPSALAQELSSVELLQAFHKGFRGSDDEVNYVRFDIEDHVGEIRRRTTISRGGVVQRESEMMAIRRG